MKNGPGPELSVVVPSVNGWRDLEGCLANLARERASVQLDVLIPERCGAAVRQAASERYPWATLLPVGPGTTIPQMRAQAFRVATAPTIAVIEDHVLVPAGWARSLVEARKAGAQVIGGIVTNGATDRLVDWAAFFCEYHHLIPPLAAGPATWLTGNNTAYDRVLLEEMRDLLETGVWEDTLHQALRERGVTLWRRPDIVAQHKKHYTVREYLSQRFLYSRGYVGLRMRNATPLRRLAFGLLTLGLPPVLLARIVSRVWRARYHRAELGRSMPLLLLFVTSYALGETVGAWFGGGDALAKVC